MVEPGTRSMDTQLGYWRWKLFRWNDHPNPYRNRSDLAFTWLSQFQGNASAMAELQNLLGHSATGGYAPIDPVLLLQQIADKMASGEIQACVEVCGPVVLQAVAGSGAEEVVPDIAQLRQAAAPAPAPLTEPPEEPTLAPDNDAAAQAQALKDAAKKGAPFCEECAKASQAKITVTPSPATTSAPAPAEPPSTLGPDNDAPAQAQALREAAETGAPFCAECEKAREEMQAKSAALHAGVGSGGDDN
jgi:hypothetical protein